MKKFILMFCLFIASMNVFAQKSYVTLKTAAENFSDPYGTGAVLKGDVPGDKNTFNRKNIGEILNILSQYGYEVEFTMTYDKSVIMILSKGSSYNPSRVRSVTSEDEDVQEVARYNLQGLPVNEKEKGVQIIVYSNYTTKTVIVQ